MAGMKKLSFERKTLQRFGITMGLAFLFISVIFLLKHKQLNVIFLLISVLFFLLSVTATAILRPIYLFWMKLGQILGWFNARLILCIIFYLVFTPIGFLIKLFRVDLLERKIDKSALSYWKKKETSEFVPENYEKQY